jgi:signal transduction histidine kinase
MEFDYIEQYLSRVLASIYTGAERLKKLVTSLQNFCHIDEVYSKPADLHRCLDHILLLINSRIKKKFKLLETTVIFLLFIAFLVNYIKFL